MKNIVCIVVSILVLSSFVTYGIDEIEIIESTNEEMYFTLLHTNDEHSSLIPHTSTTDYRSGEKNPSVGGYARLATAIKEIRRKKAEKNEQVLLVSAGDFMGGTAFSWLIPKGFAPELEVKQRLGYDAVTIGNHEYDYGTEVLAEYLKAANYPKAHEITPILATNTKVALEHPLGKEGLYKKYNIIELENGLKIGFFALIGEDAISVALNTKPVTFENQREIVQRAVLDLESQGVDIIVALSHSGIDEDKKLAKEVEGIDIIIGGHSHTTIFEPIKVKNSIIVQAGSYLQYLGMLELAYNSNTKKLRLLNNQKENPYLIPIDSSISSDPEISTLIEGYIQKLNEFTSNFTNGQFKDVLDIIAKINFPLKTKKLQESPFGNFITDGMRLVTGEVLGEPVDVAIQANGSIRGNLIPGSMDYSKGLVSFYDLASLVGLGYGTDGNGGYPIVSFYLTGEEIYRVLEVAALLSETMGDNYFLQFSGLRYYYNPKDVVLFNVPIKNIPIPSTRAVKKAEIYRSNGIQSDKSKEYIELDRKDKKLYHVVTDSYILSFLPMAGKLAPKLDIVPKDREGNPLTMDEFDKLIVYKEDKQLKVWQTVVEYAALQKLDKDGYPTISNYYENTSGRINPINTISIVTWPILVLIIIVSIITFKTKRFKKYK